MLRFIGAAATVTRHAEFLVCHQDGDFFSMDCWENSGYIMVYNALTVKDRDISWEYNKLKKWDINGYHLKTMDH